MRVLLIDPPFYRFIGYFNRYFPLGLAYLASVLRSGGHDVLIYDADCNVRPTKMDYAALEDSYPHYLKCLADSDHDVWMELRKLLQSFKPDLVGISVWTSFAGSAFKAASLCKEYDSSLPVVMGGPHVTIMADEVLTICPDVDFLVRSEGEQSFLQLVRTMERDVHLKDGGIVDPGGRLSGVAGISYRKNHQIIHQAPAAFLPDLDAVPFPARDLLINKSSYQAEDMGLLMTSRGCPYRCTYCATGIWERKVRYRSVANVIQEMKTIIGDFGTRQFAFKDDSFTLNRKRVFELCNRMLEEGLNVGWDCNARADSIDMELLNKMKEAGCNGIKVGIETGSERIMKLIDKNITLAECIRAAELLKRSGIHWTGYFMMGLPTETRDDMRQTLDFMRRLEPDYASISVYEPYPGTALFRLGIEKGLVQENRSREYYFSLSPKYYFIRDPNRRIDTMSNAEFLQIEGEMKEAFHKWNRGLPRLAKRFAARSRLYVREPKTIWGDFNKFLSWL